jgi:hypothetical protein
VLVVQSYCSQVTYCCAKPKEERVRTNPREERTLAKLRVEGCGEDVTRLLFQSQKKKGLMSQFLLFKFSLT